MPAWCPFRLQFYGNGHNWLAGQLRRRQIAFEMLDNAFVAIADWSTAQQLADRWIEEAKNGIEGTGIYPGFIKIAVERAPLQEINRKVVEAACIAHKATGLTIMSHTGPAVPAFQQIEVLKQNGISPSAFIWTHANNEKEWSKIIDAAKMGVWIAFDKFEEKETENFSEFAVLMKKEGLLNRLIFSHDAGWYDPMKPGVGTFRDFTAIEERSFY